jgi:tetratricopeptide (TPR) repeat protein
MTEASANQWHQREIDTAKGLLEGVHAAIQQGNLSGADAEVDEALVVLDMADAEGVTDEQRELRARALNEKGLILQQRGDTADAYEAHRRAADLVDTVETIDDDNLGSAAAIHLNFGQLSLLDDDYATSARENRRALELIERLREVDENNALSLAMGAYQNMTALESFRGNFDTAAEHAEEAIDTADTIAERGGTFAISTAAQVCQQLSVQLFQRERYEEAVEWGERAESLSERAFNEAGPEALDAYVVSEINLISFHESARRYADAEDCLWKAMDVSNNDPEVIRRGLNFYESCRKQADARLEKGGLPRDEVDEAYEELKEIALEKGVIQEG